MRAMTPVPKGAGDGIGTGALLGTLMLGTVPVGAGVDCVPVVVPVVEVLPGVVPDEGPDVEVEVVFDDVQATSTAAVAHDAAMNAATRVAVAPLDRARTPLPSTRL